MSVFPRWFGEDCKYSGIDRAGRKSLEVGREDLQADSPRLLEPGAKEAKATPSASLKASDLPKRKNSHPWRPMAPTSWPVTHRYIFSEQGERRGRF